MPQNWEEELGRYERLGPFAREPFRYFEEEARAGRLPYPSLSLLPAFEQAEEFPLYLSDDPHWNAAGSRFAARALLPLLLSHGLLPCQ